MPSHTVNHFVLTSAKFGITIVVLSNISDNRVIIGKHVFVFVNSALVEKKFITVQHRHFPPPPAPAEFYRMLLITRVGHKSIISLLITLHVSNTHVLESVSNDVRSNNFVLYKLQNYMKT
jgi:hypothetical protein